MPRLYVESLPTLGSMQSFAYSPAAALVKAPQSRPQRLPERHRQECLCRKIQPLSLLTLFRMMACSIS